MSERTIRIAMNGVTGRMGYRQHLMRSILVLREQGISLPDGDRLLVEPVLVGRDAEKLAALAKLHDIPAWSTSLDEVLEDPTIDVYFDAQVTAARGAALAAAIAAGKHVYTEKPVAESSSEALALARQAVAAGVRHGVVADKLYLPGILKLRRLVDAGFFGRILSIRGEFGYWVFEGDWQLAQRPSWNYRIEDGGGITLDMLPHWRYLLEDIFGTVQTIYAQAATHIPVRYDESGHAYRADADDAAYTLMSLDGGIVAQLNSSWTVRVNRDDLVEFQVDGTEGSAVAGLRSCRVQHRATTPKPVWDPDEAVPGPYRSQWQEVPDNGVFRNAFQAQWVEFLTDVALDEPHRHDLVAGARGVQLAELASQSSTEGRRLAVPALKVTA